MAELAIPAAEATGVLDVRTTQDPQNLAGLSGTRAAEEIRGSNFNELAQNALNSALKQIGDKDAATADRATLMGTGPNAVDDVKGGIMSDVARPGTDTAQTGSTEEVLNAVTDRAQNLYGEMMVHHIAWGVAQRMQKDMSQLLRGS